jgi:hypothetical protein
MPTRKLIIAVCCIGVALVWMIGKMGLINFGLQQSGTGFSIGGHSVVITYGYFGNGDELAFAIIQTWPIGTPEQQMLSDKRVDMNSGATPRIKSSDGRYVPVDTSGTVYMFFGDELRTMRVTMDEHTDTVGLRHKKDLEGVWSHFKQFERSKD